MSTAAPAGKDRERIVLYNPRAVFWTMPLSLLAVGSALDPERYDVEIVDGRLEADPVARVLEATASARVLGVTVLTGAPIRDALEVSRAAKRKRPDLVVVWGGWHPSLFATETLAEPAVDVTVQGQGEVTFGELVARLALGAGIESLEGVPGLCFRGEDGSVRASPARPLLSMDELPRHRYDLIPVERYFERKGHRQLDYISSTGCPFRCAFCADPFVYKRRWVALQPGRMGEELEELHARYRISELAFQDETFFVYRDRVIAIADEILRRGLRFDWTATLRADQGSRLGDEAFALCVRSGLRRVMIGVEAGSQDMLDWMEKDIEIEQVFESAEMCLRHDVAAIFPFIVGFPNESDASIRTTLDTIKRLRRMSPRFETPVFYFKPYPGSRITDEVVRQGHTLPQTLEEWAEFDFIESAGPWVSAATRDHVERFKFYNRFAGGPETWLRRPLQWVSRWRCRRDFYRLPIEKVLVERIRPLPRLS